MMKTIKNIILFVITLGVMLVVLDLFIKYTGISQVTIFTYDNKLGRVFENNAEYNLLTEGFAMGNINSYGYIGPDYGEDKRDGVLRIALLGDSYIEGFQHFDRNHLRSVIENELKEKYGIDAEVMNFGKFGYDLGDMYVLDRNYVSKFKPDIVIYFLSNRDLTEQDDMQRSPYPYLERDSILIHYDPPPGEGLPWFLSINKMGMISPIVQMVRNSINLINAGQTPGILFGKFYNQVYTENRPADNILNENDSLTDLQKKIIEMLSREKGKIVVHRDRYDLNWNIKSVINTSGIEFIELNDTLNVLRENGFNPNYWKHSGKEGHWNLTAHKVIGEFLARKIAENKK